MTRRLSRWAPWIIIATGLIAYANSFTGEFILDDVPWIVRNEKIRTLWPPWTALSGTSRPLTQFSFAWNYAAGGLDVRGYHAVNLAIHILAALVLWMWLRRLFGSMPNPNQAGGLALVCAMIWIAHPLNTESVSYVVQRAESLMGLLVLLTMWSAWRAVGSDRTKLWQATAVAFCWLAAATKATMALLPVLVLVQDRVFLSGSWREAWRKRKWMYVVMGGSWIFLIGLGLASREEWGASAGFNVAGVTPWMYAQTQPEAIWHYLRLAIWPDRLCLLHDWAWTRDSFRMTMATGALILVLGTAAFAWRRAPPMAFWCVWFVLLIAPTSSVIPLLHPVFEHRMYLPLVGVIVTAVIGANTLLRYVTPKTQSVEQFGLVIVALLVIALTVRTRARNEDYRTEVSIWETTLSVAPNNPHARRALALAYATRGQTAQAIIEFKEALRLKPGWASVHHDWGQLLHRTGDRDGARHQYLEALRSDPGYAAAYYDLGVWAYEAGDLRMAERCFWNALQADPGSVSAQQNLHRVRRELIGREIPVR